MADQIATLSEKGIPAASLNSSMGVKETRLVKEGLSEKKYKLLYIAPETLLNEELLVFLLQTNNISLIAIDECHVISSWGTSFRPKYRKLAELKDYFPDIPFIALTATLNKIGTQDVIDTLKMDSPVKFIHSLDRPSIQYNVFMKTDSNKQIVSIIDRHINKAGIIYCSTVSQVDELCTYLQYKGYNCKPYHSKLKKKEKETILDDYLKGDIDIIVATIAFGMGIDKVDIRFVIHNNLPSSVDAYLQETGRAARDGKKSSAYLLYDSDDKGLYKFLWNKTIKNPVALKIVNTQLEKLDNILTNTYQCRRKLLLKEFDEDIEDCGNCDVCLNYYTLKDSL